MQRRIRPTLLKASSPSHHQLKFDQPSVLLLLLMAHHLLMFHPAKTLLATLSSHTNHIEDPLKLHNLLPSRIALRLALGVD
jgi:hypothetical protein